MKSESPLSALIMSKSSKIALRLFSLDFRLVLSSEVTSCELDLAVPAGETSQILVFFPDFSVCGSLFSASSELLYDLTANSLLVSLSSKDIDSFLLPIHPPIIMIC
ncbi:unnamed protein product [Moneuplotes crassus]|uniref:Uncharacterized protein n=1 Tax=Euplotes crassus TaxID=5936 RepID=A0AAD2D7F1_EUPCR|nr:unnamed protein product [Moneuplotes crassus]